MRGEDWLSENLSLNKIDLTLSSQMLYGRGLVRCTPYKALLGLFLRIRQESVGHRTDARPFCLPYQRCGTTHSDAGNATLLHYRSV